MSKVKVAKPHSKIITPYSVEEIKKTLIVCDYDYEHNAKFLGSQIFLGISDCVPPRLKQTCHIPYLACGHRLVTQALRLTRTEVRMYKLITAVLSENNRT